MQALENRNVYEPLELTPRQRQVLEVLKDTETEQYPLSKWYHGVLYVLDNPHNPDRVSQAAQSLRELVEKLLEVVPGIAIQTKPSSKKSTFQEKRSDIEKHILAYKESHLGNWEGQTINSDLAKGLTTLEEYLDLSKQPSRSEKIANVVTSIDPMFNQLNTQIQIKNKKRLRDLWRKLEGFAHHNSKTEEKFRTCLEELEKTVFALLAPITAQDQAEMQAILNRSDRSENDIEQMFALIERRGANFVFFFKHAAETADATWLPLLNERGYFADPPDAELVGDDMVSFSFWWPIHYLAKIANQVPDEVIEIVQHLPRVDNPWIYRETVEIVLQLHGRQSAELKQKILESTNITDDLLEFKYAGLLAHWVAENQTSAALELIRVLVKFVPDPQSEAKRKRRRENPAPETIWTTSLEPSPRIGAAEYYEIMSEGVRPLAEKAPYQVAHILIDATVDMIRLQTHQEDSPGEADLSESWCKNLRNSDRYHENSKATLVHTLTFACEQVYKKSPDSVVALDKALRNQQWKLFKRLRQHLYAQYPNEETKLWIQELIIEYEEYYLWEYHYEFQQMIWNACKHFGETLLTKAERIQIFDAIRSGPPKKDFQEWQGEAFTEEKFLQRQRYFHRKQFKPFEPLLFGEYATYFRELEGKATDSISDEDYLPIKTKAGFVSHRSPIALEDLTKFTDEQLLSYINEWEDERISYEDDPFVEINIKALAETFQTVFKDMIIPDANRLHFWMKNRERIQRPIYVQMMIIEMQAAIKEKNFDRLNEWLVFSEWVLSHTEQDSYGLSEKYQANPNWHDLRRDVCDLIGTCLKEEVNVPTSVRGQLAKLLEMLCTQFDSWLDSGRRRLPEQNDPFAEGINNTRSRALQALIDFGFWLQRDDTESQIPEVTMILAKRFAPETEYPLTPPEYAILGINYPQIFNFNKAWATNYKSDFFPQGVLPAWLAAFSSFVGYSHPFETTFEILQDNFDYALQYLTDLKNRDGSNEKQTDRFGLPLKQNGPKEKLIEGLGQHLFHYYLWGMQPLKGTVGNNTGYSLLERYYQVTDNNREDWATLFNYIGRILRNTDKQLAEDLKDRIIAFFDWRLEVQEPTELQQFTFWLEAKCLEPEWQLEAYSQILDVCKPEGWSIATQVKTLCEFPPDYTTKVIECFAKLSNVITDSNIYILEEAAKTILKAGFESSDESVRRQAKRVHDDLLRGGRSDLLYLED